MAMPLGKRLSPYVDAEQAEINTTSTMYGLLLETRMMPVGSPGRISGPPVTMLAQPATASSASAAKILRINEAPRHAAPRGAHDQRSRACDSASAFWFNR